MRSRWIVLGFGENAGPREKYIILSVRTSHDHLPGGTALFFPGNYYYLVLPLRGNFYKHMEGPGRGSDSPIFSAGGRLSQSPLSRGYCGATGQRGIAGAMELYVFITQLSGSNSSGVWPRVFVMVMWGTLVVWTRRAMWGTLVVWTRSCQQTEGY